MSNPIPPKQPVDPGVFGHQIEREGKSGNLDRFIRTTGYLLTGQTGRNRFPNQSPHGPNTLLYTTHDGTPTGQIQRYVVYNHLSQIVKRVDLFGAPHGSVATPHVNEYVLHMGKFVTPSDLVRPAFQWEIP